MGLVYAAVNRPAQQNSAGPEPSPPWGRALPLLITRLLANLGLRFPYTFGSAIARGLGVDLEAVTRILGLRELGGLASPLAGRWSDRGHLARVATVSGVVAGLSLAAAATGGVWMFGVAVAVGGIATFSLYVAQNSWIGHAIPIQRRARMFGIIETAWAGAFLLGVPVVGWLISAWGWRAAFWGVGPALAIASVWSGRRLSIDIDLPEVDPDQSTSKSVRVPHRHAIAAFVFAQPMAQMLVFAIYGDWFETRLGLSLAGIGVATAAVGIAELVGTLATIGISDRFGPARVGWITLGLAACPMAALGWVGTRPVVGVCVVVAIAVLIECSFVSVLPVLTEIDPQRRAAAIARMTVVITVSRALGAPLAGTIYTDRGISSIGWGGAAMCILGAAALILGTSRRWGRSA